MKDRDVLIALLAAWARSGARDAKTDADLIRAIELAGDRAAKGLVVKGEWMAAAKRNDPVERGLLLASVQEAPHPKWMSRWAALAKSGDPRVLGKLAERGIPGTKEARQRYLAMLVDGARDRRVVAVAAEAARAAKRKGRYHAPDWVAEVGGAKRRTAEAHRAAAKASEPLSKADTALIASVLAARDAGGADDAARDAELIAAIYAAPGEDGPRSIYADWLQEKGDPRGEFIALQLRENPTAKQRARIDELETAHREVWLGAIAALTHDVLFRRGFVDCVRWHAYEPNIPDAAVWSTVETATHLPPKSGQRTLTFVMGASNADIARLGELPADAPLETLQWRRPESGKTLERAIAAYKKAKLPALRTFEIEQGAYDAAWHPSKLGWIFAGRALEKVGVPADPTELPAYLALFGKLAPGLESLHLDSQGGFIWLDRRDEGLELTLYANRADANDAALAGLEALPPNQFVRAKITTSSKAGRIRDRFVAALARHADCAVELES